MHLDEILRTAVRLQASDVLLKVGVPPGLRLKSDLIPMPEARPLTHELIEAAVDVIFDDYHRRRFSSELQADLAYETPELGRFRVNVFRQRGEISIVIRVIPSRIRNV